MYQLRVPQGQGDLSAPSTTDPLICGFCLVTTPNTRGKTVEQSIVTWMFAREFITNNRHPGEPQLTNKPCTNGRLREKHNYGRTHRQVAGNDNTRRPKLASGKNLQIYKILNMPGYDGLSFWVLCRSPRGSFDMCINHLSMQIRLGYAYRPQDDTRRNNCLHFNEIGEKTV